MSNITKPRHLSISSIRDLFAQYYYHKEFVIDKTGVKTIEIIGASFLADENIIFSKANDDYINRELKWYLSGSYNVNDFEGDIPHIWHKVADKDGNVNSNYGTLVFGKDNYNQFSFVVAELKRNQFSRRAMIIFNRPSIVKDYNLNGRDDYICTTSYQFLIRHNKLELIVNQRSLDIVYGYSNDKPWADFVHNKLLSELIKTYPGLLIGNILWNCGSAHLYERHFYLIEYYLSTGIYDVKKLEAKNYFNLRKIKGAKMIDKTQEANQGQIEKANEEVLMTKKKKPVGKRFNEGYDESYERKAYDKDYYDNHSKYYERAIPGFQKFILDNFEPFRSIADIGCGTGAFIEGFQVSKSVFGYDFSDGSKLTHRLYPENFYDRDLSKPNATVEAKNVDIALSLETYEHIFPEFELNYLENIFGLGSKYVIISCAVPGQIGRRHVNCRTQEDVIATVELIYPKYKLRNDLMEKFSKISYLASFYRKNTLIYEKEGDK